MSIQQAIELTGHVAWPFVALMTIFVLRPYISQLTRAAGDLRELLNRSGEMVDLVSQIAALNEATSDIKAMQEVALASRSEAAPAAAPADIDRVWSALEQQWRETRDSFRAVAQSAGVPVSFIGTIGVREAGKALVEKGVISEATASAMVDTSARYQFLYRTTNRSEYLNDNVLASYTKAATAVRQALKAGP